MSKQPTYNDLMQGRVSELKKTYNISDRQIEQSIRKHTDGSNPSERREFYESVYSSKRKS